VLPLFRCAAYFFGCHGLWPIWSNPYPVVLLVRVGMLSVSPVGCRAAVCDDWTVAWQVTAQLCLLLHC